MRIRHALAGLALVICAGCDGGIWVNAKVVDASGAPISNASSRLSFRDYQDKFDDSSNKNGCISLGGVIAPMREEWELEIEAPGYKRFFAKVISAEQHTLLVTLQPDGSRLASSSQVVTKNDGCAL